MLLSKWVLMDYVAKCNSLRAFKQIHAPLLVGNFVRDDALINGAVSFFGKSSEFSHYGCQFLNHINRGLSSFPFNCLISGYASCDKPQASVLVYRKLVGAGFSPDSYTFPAVLKSCSKFLGIGEGLQVHGLVIKMGFARDMYVQNSLVHLYSAGGNCESARKVFDEIPVRDVVSWTGIISGFVRAGFPDEALELFSEMDVEPRVATFVSAIVACGKRGDLVLGQALQGLVIKRACETNLEISNALIDMYVRWESLHPARRVFNELDDKDIVSWTSLISGLVQCKRPSEAIEMFNLMRMSGMKPDRIILTSVLSACANLGNLDYGKWIHEYIVGAGIEWDVHIGTALVDMYTKCGCVDTALVVFNEMKKKNVYTWNALLGGLGIHGHGSQALAYFKEMVRVGFKPNEVTFLAVLTACCHSGLVDEGRHYFYEMKGPNFDLSPSLEHYGCMVDLFCRAGLLEEALQLLKTMPMPPDVLICGAILSACKEKGASTLPQEILDRVLELECRDSGVFVLLSNIYAANGRWGDVAKVRNLMKETGISKTPGSSLIEVEAK